MRSVFDSVGRNGGRREDLRDRLNVRRRSLKCALVNNQQQDRLPRNIRVADLREALNVLNRQEDELVARYHNSPFIQDIRVAPLHIGFKLPMMTSYEGKIDP